MKAIVITPQNCNQIWAKLTKFFSHPVITTWHTYDCGMKKHIPHKMKGRANTMECYHRAKASLFDKEHFCIQLDRNNSFTIRMGDTIAFVGNRIIVKHSWKVFGTYDWLYHCYQIGTPTTFPK